MKIIVRMMLRKDSNNAFGDVQDDATAYAKENLTFHITPNI